MATEINVHGHLITNTYKTITPEYASLHIVQTSGVYEFKTLVNTCFINELKKFIWFRLNTADGTYFATSLNNDNKKILSQLHIFEDLNKTLLLHRFIAALARLPNPRNEIYVDHIDRQTLDNRRENLTTMFENATISAKTTDESISTQAIRKHTNLHLIMQSNHP